MGIQVGGMDLANELLNALHRIGTLEKMVEALINNRSIDQSDIDRFKDESFKELQKRIPGIKKS